MKLGELFERWTMPLTMPLKRRHELRKQRLAKYEDVRRSWPANNERACERRTRQAAALAAKKAKRELPA